MFRSRIICLFLLGCFGSATLRAADCSALKNLTLPNATITMAEKVTSGDVEGPTIRVALHKLPVFCRVVGVLRPTADSEIGFEVWLPDSGWNGRFIGVGNGGFAGSIDSGKMSGNLRRGFATAGTDTGHQNGDWDASWALGHPEKVKDYGWRAVHMTALRSKDIVAAYYGKGSDKAYFDSCSDGGREALMEAQRFPEDYDGILAGAPANAWTLMLSGGLDVTQRSLGDPRAYTSSFKLPAIQQASLAACDALDGVKDGIISDPEKCRFDPEVLLCKGAESTTCLTQPQVDALKAVYAGGKDSHGKSIIPGLMMGDEYGGWSSMVGQGPGAGTGVEFLENYFRYMVTGNPKWNLLTANVDASLAKAIKVTRADVDAINPDLAPFEAHGGKLIIYHGWNDPAVPPRNSINYYMSVKKQMGAQQADNIMRLYMAPGMEHCLGGPGPNSLGQFGLATAKGPKYGLFDALVGWVEKGIPAGEIVATKYESGTSKVKMTRPLCPYPAIAKYKGSGDTNDSANFVCSKE